jgi:Holliday junction resolvase RusA-like endonuclease
LVKGVLDCLQPAGWLTDDALIDGLAVMKCRSDEPRLEVEMREL